MNQIYTISPTGRININNQLMQEFKLKRGATIHGTVLTSDETKHHVLVDHVTDGLGKKDWQKNDKIFIPLDQIVKPEVTN